MALGAGQDRNSPHITIGGIPYKLDESFESGDSPLRRWTKLPASVQVNFTGQQGSEDLSDDLVWEISDFDGEGQKVLLARDPDLARRFYTSEGLDFRIPGEFKLNKSTILTKPRLTSTTDTTLQGAADFADVSGTASTTSGTDRKLTDTTTLVGVSRTPGAKGTTVDFYLYAQPNLDGTTTVQGSAFVGLNPWAKVNGTDVDLRSGGVAWSTVISSGFANRDNYAIYLDAYRSNIAGRTDQGWIQAAVYDVTNGDPVLTGNFTGTKLVTFTNANITDTSSPASPNVSLNFIARSGRSYRVRTINSGYSSQGSPGATKPDDENVSVDKLRHGPAQTPGANRATISIYNTTDTTEVTSRVVTVNATAAGSLVASIPFSGTAAKTYSYRVIQASPPTELGSITPQPIWVDKVTEKVETAAAENTEFVHLGQGGKVWAFGAAGVLWTYNFSTNAWDKGSATTSTSPVRGAAATDQYEYVLCANGHIYRCTTAAADQYTTSALTGPVGIAICQDRIFALTEDTTNGVDIQTYAVDGTPTIAATATLSIQTAGVSPDTTLRQRMCGTPTGARFFVNHGGVKAEIWECDSSGATLTAYQVAELPLGAKATAIAYSDGLTYVTAQFAAESGTAGASALWVIDQDDDIEFVGWFRRDSALTNPPIGIQPYENDVYILEGGTRLWRFNLTRGGLFLEYEAVADTVANQRGIAVLKNRIFAAFTGASGGVWVTGSVGTYRQAGSTNANQFTSSIYHFGVPHGNKVLNNVTLLTDDMPDNTLVKVEYQVDQDGTWQHLGNAVVGGGFEGSSSHFVFQGPTDTDSVSFRTLQIRATLATTDGVSTPTVRSIVVRAALSGDISTVGGTGIEEFIDALVLCGDEDSGFRIAGQQISGYLQSSNLHTLRSSGDRTTLVNGYESNDASENPTYTVQIKQVDQQYMKRGESRFLVRMKLVA